MHCEHCVNKAIMHSYMQVHGAITGKGTAKLPWERTPLDTDIRQQLGVFRKVVLQLLDRNPGSRPSMQDFCAACERVFAQTQSLTSSSDAGLQVRNIMHGLPRLVSIVGGRVFNITACVNSLNQGSPHVHFYIEKVPLLIFHFSVW